MYAVNKMVHNKKLQVKVCQLYVASTNKLICHTLLTYDV